MTRAVLDNNTIVSGLGWAGPPGAVLDAALAGHVEIVTSPALLDEPRRVLADPKVPAVIGDTDELIDVPPLAPIVVTPRSPSYSSATPTAPAHRHCGCRTPCDDHVAGSRCANCGGPSTRYRWSSMNSLMKSQWWRSSVGISLSG